MPRELVLAIDVGTSAVRAALVDGEGSVAASKRVERPDSASGLVFDSSLLWNQLGEAIGALDPIGKRSVRSIAIAGHIGTVFTDADFEPVWTGMGWADSTGVDLLAALYDGVSEARQIGRPMITGGAAAASLRFRSTDAAAFGSVRHILSPKDFLVARLTGAASTDYTTAAYTSVSSVATRAWSTELLSRLELDPALFPDQVSSTDVVGGIRRAAAEQLGLPVGIPVISGGPDGTVGAMFVLGGRTGAIANVAGTTDVLVHPIGSVHDAPAGSTINPYPLGAWSAGGSTGMTGGALNRWASIVGSSDASDAMTRFADRIEAIGPGSEGLVVRPTLSGSRFPRWNPAELGLVCDQSDAHGPAHFLRATAEGAAYVVREGIDLLAADSTIPVVLAGGAARSQFLSRMRADILGRTVLVCVEPDVSLMGAAMLALIGGGIHATSKAAADAMQRETVTIEPDEQNAAIYESLFTSWLQRTGASRRAVSA